jgi:hypothetical protein
VGCQPTKTSEEKCNVKCGARLCRGTVVSPHLCLPLYILTAVFATSQKKWPHLPDIVTSQPDCRLHNNIWRGGYVGRLLSPPPPNSKTRRRTCHEVRGSCPCQCTRVWSMDAEYLHVYGLVKVMVVCSVTSYSLVDWWQRFAAAGLQFQGACLLTLKMGSADCSKMLEPLYIKLVLRVLEALETRVTPFAPSNSSRTESIFFIMSCCVFYSLSLFTASVNTPRTHWQ